MVPLDVVASAANIVDGESDSVLYEGSMSAAVDRFYEIIYKDHSYGRRPTIDNFNDLSVEDVANFHVRNFVPQNMTIAVAGAIDVEAISDRLVALFGNWVAAGVPDVEQIPAITRTKAALHYFKSDKLQSWLVIGHDPATGSVRRTGRTRSDELHYGCGASKYPHDERNPI